MASNPYDQFDSAGSNPYDRFDTADSAANANPSSGLAGMAKFAAGTLGTPATILKGLVNAPGMVAGIAAAAAGRPDLAPNVIDIPGGPAFYENLLKKTGVGVLNPENPNPENKAATTAYELASRGGFIPGNVLPAVGSMVAEKIGGPQWAGLGALAPSAATAAFNAARAPVLAKLEAQNRVKDATLKDAQDAGYVLPPSAVKPNPLVNSAESFAGKAALKQEAQLKNQQVTNDLVRKEFNLPPDAPLTTSTLEDIRSKAGSVYGTVQSLSGMSDILLNKLRDARQQATQYFKFYDRTADPNALRTARYQDNQANVLERLLEKEVAKQGHPELIDKLRAARTEIAKTYDVERALNVGNGNVDARIIGRAIDRGRPLTGNLAIIGKFAEGPGAQFTREGSMVPAAGVSALNWPAAAVLGYEGLTHLGTKGVSLAALPFARGGVRQGLLSDYYQQNFNRPNYTPAVEPQGTLQSILQQAILANRQQ